MGSDGCHVCVCHVPPLRDWDYFYFLPCTEYWCRNFFLKIVTCVYSTHPHALSILHLHPVKTDCEYTQGSKFSLVRPSHAYNVTTHSNLNLNSVAPALAPLAPAAPLAPLAPAVPPPSPSRSKKPPRPPLNFRHRNANERCRRRRRSSFRRRFDT